MSTVTRFCRAAATATTLAIIATALSPAAAQAADPFLYGDCRVNQPKGDKGTREGKILVHYVRNSGYLTVTGYSFNLLGLGGSELGNKNNVEIWLMKQKSGKDTVLDHWRSADNVRPELRKITSDDTEKRAKFFNKGTKLYAKAKFTFDDRGVADVSCTATTDSVKA